jgi:eukaryotic-like serine/threonine-protein kinase
MSTGTPVDISPMADTVAAPSDADGGIPVDIERGTSVGRYLVIGRLGAGGMGVVFAAYDPKLDRKVALKALHRAVDPAQDSAGRARLVREAKAMARLSHPNVVTVYDVVVDGDRALVAMELVEGESLRDWLASTRRTWREIVDAFQQAARGMVSAHEAGIVHRDFKLDNVLVGKDGRVRVGDFGLARVAPSELAPNTESNAAIALGASGAGGIAGTPAYMAPDQLRGAPGDARSDQFSFCTALHEALYGERPFAGETVMALLDSIDSQQVRPAPPGTQVPRWVRAVILRGLCARPDQRYGSMREVLEALERDPSVRRRRVLSAAVAASVVLLAAGGVAAGMVATRKSETARCLALSKRLDGVWDDATKGAVRGAFRATGRPYADDTYARTASVLDAFATSWTTDRVAQCEASVHKPASHVLQARAECLDQRLGEVRAFVAELRRADASTVDHAAEGARALPGLDVCEGNDPSHGRVWPSDPVVRDRARALLDQMGVVDAMAAAGRYPEALKLAQQNTDQALDLGFLPIVPEALESLALQQQGAGDLAGAEKTFHDAEVAAERVGDASVAARAWMGAARRTGDHGDSARMEAEFDHAEAWTDRVGDDDLLRAKLWYLRGLVYSDAGRLEESRALVQKAFDLYEKHRDERDAMQALNGLGIDADLQGHVEEATGYYQRVLAWREQTLGPEHPNVAGVLNNLGLMFNENGKYDAAAPLLERALRIRQQAYGPSHRTVSQSLTSLALVYVHIGRQAEALDMAQRALAIFEKVHGPVGRPVASALDGVCKALLALGRFDEAVPLAARELAILDKTGGADVDVADAKANLGVALVRSKQDSIHGRALLAEARASFVQQGRTARVVAIDEALSSR